jgi:hypothetical protein
MYKNNLWVQKSDCLDLEFTVIAKRRRFQLDLWKFDTRSTATPEGSRKPYAWLVKRVRSREKESIVTKRVPFGELFVFLRTNDTS